MSRLTVVVDNSVALSMPLLGEHGLSFWLEHQGVNLLYDTGWGRALLGNLKALELAPNDLDAVVLSHGHLDHTGGLEALLKARSGPTPVWCHRAVFNPHFSQRNNQTRDIGPRLSQEQYQGLGAEFHWVDGQAQPWPGITLLAPIPRNNDFEGPAPGLMTTSGGEMIPDPFDDDLSILLKGQAGPVVLTGCAHAGALNILAAASAAAGQPVSMLVGGTHLGPAPQKQQDAALAQLAAMPELKIVAGHCTGQDMCGRLQGILGQRFSHLAAGKVLEL